MGGRCRSEAVRHRAKGCGAHLARLARQTCLQAGSPFRFLVSVLLQEHSVYGVALPAHSLPVSPQAPPGLVLCLRIPFQGRRTVRPQGQAGSIPRVPGLCCLAAATHPAHPFLPQALPALPATLAALPGPACWSWGITSPGDLPACPGACADVCWLLSQLEPSASAPLPPLVPSGQCG